MLDAPKTRSCAEIFLDVLRRYLCERGHIVLPMARTAGQDVLRISLRGLWRRYEPGIGEPPDFTSVAKCVMREDSEYDEVKRHGILGFTVDRGEIYVVAKLDSLEKLVEGCEEEPRNK